MDEQRVFANSVVGGFANQHPQTLRDIFVEQRDGIREKLSGFIGIPPGWGVGNELGHFMDLDQIIDKLPEPRESFKHVYLACVPHQAWPISFSHWSVFSHGRFYHLSVPNLDSGLKYQSGSGIEKSENVVLKVENMHDEDPSNLDVPGRPPLVAYEIGSTDYSPQEIQTIAEWVIRQMPIYDLFSKNCQVFALSMIYRTVMTKRDASVFVGTKQQISQWDGKHTGLVDDRGAHVNNRENGFLVQEPNSVHITKMARFFHLEKLTNNLSQHQRHVLAIRRLYMGGPLTPGAHDPTGTLGPFQYALSRISIDMKETGNILSRVGKELAQDIAAGRLKNALIGRKDTRREMFLGYKRDMEEGQAFGKAMLYFHAFVLYGSMGRARRMTANETPEDGVEIRERNAEEGVIQ